MQSRICRPRTRTNAHLHGHQSAVLAQTEECRHECVALLTSFALMDFVDKHPARGEWKVLHRTVNQRATLLRSLPLTTIPSSWTHGIQGRMPQFRQWTTLSCWDVCLGLENVANTFTSRARRQCVLEPWPVRLLVPTAVRWCVRPTV